ncbi:MAG: hypothetical protein IJ618_05115 [Prevotella sp.]|nr:hypothetical protein [Prevotella sp.]
MNEKEIKKDIATTSEGIMQNNDSEYVRLLTNFRIVGKGKRKGSFCR